jgi:hypothetical protein
MFLKKLSIITLVSLLLASCGAATTAPSQTPSPSASPATLTPVPKTVPVTETPVQETETPPMNQEQPTASETASIIPTATIVRGVAFVTHAELLEVQKNPPRVVLHITGATPTPCHQLIITIPSPDADRRILAEVYTTIDPTLLCAQVLKDFDEKVNFPELPAGTYHVWVNDSLVGDMTVP